MQDGLTELQKDILRQVERATPQVLALPEPNRSKAIVGLAYEYFLQDMEEKAFGLLEQADPNYFKEGKKKDLEDPLMNKIFFTIIGKLIESGYVTVKEAEDAEEKR